MRNVSVVRKDVILAAAIYRTTGSSKQHKKSEFDLFVQEQERFVGFTSIGFLNTISLPQPVRFNLIPSLFVISMIWFGWLKAI